MCDELGLEEHNVFPGDFPVKNVNSRTFSKVIDWCKEHKSDPEPVVDKDPLTQECKWFAFTSYDKIFFDVPIPELLEIVMAANYLNIPRLYHYACQSVAARIKGKSPRGLCEVLQQDCDLSRARIEKIYADNPWLCPNAIFIPNEVLVTVFEKLPRADLERLQLVSTQFNDVIVSSSELSEKQGPLRVVTRVEFRQPCGKHFSVIDLWLPDGTRVTCTGYKNLAKRLMFATVLKLCARYGGMYYAGISTLLPTKLAWKNATVEATCTSRTLFEYVFTHVLLCKEIILHRKDASLTWDRRYMRLPAIVACNKLDILGLIRNGGLVQPDDIVEWLEHEVPPETKCSEPREMILDQKGIFGGIDGLLIALKAAFSASVNPKPYVVRIFACFHHNNLDEMLTNEKTHERLTFAQDDTQSFCINP